MAPAHQDRGLESKLLESTALIWDEVLHEQRFSEGQSSTTGRRRDRTHARTNLELLALDDAHEDKQSTMGALKLGLTM